MSSQNLFFFLTQWFENDQEYVKFLSKQICWRYKPISILAISHFWYDILIILLVFGSLTTSIKNNQLLFSYCFLTTAEYSWNFFSLNKIWLQHTNRDHGTIRTYKSSTSPTAIFRKFCLLILAQNSIKSKYIENDPYTIWRLTCALKKTVIHISWSKKAANAVGNTFGSVRSI